MHVRVLSDTACYYFAASAANFIRMHLAQLDVLELRVSQVAQCCLDPIVV